MPTLHRSAGRQLASWGPADQGPVTIPAESLTVQLIGADAAIQGSNNAVDWVTLATGSNAFARVPAMLYLRSGGVGTVVAIGEE